MRRGSMFWGHTSPLQVPKTLGRLWFWLDNCVLRASFSLPCTSRLPAFSLVVFSPYRNLPFIFSTTEDFQGCDQMPLLPGSPPGCPQSESIALYSAYLQQLMIKSNMLRVQFRHAWNAHSSASPIELNGQRHDSIIALFLEEQCVWWLGTSFLESDSLSLSLQPATDQLHDLGWVNISVFEDNYVLCKLVVWIKLIRCRKYPALVSSFGKWR